MGQGNSGLGEPAWADGDRAFAKSAEGHGAGHPNANIVPVQGFADCDAFGQPYGAASDPELAALAIRPVAPIKLGPGGDCVCETTPTGWNWRDVFSGWLWVLWGFLVGVIVAGSIAIMLGAGKADPYARVLPAIEAWESKDLTDFYGDWVDDNNDKIEQPEECRAWGAMQIRMIMVEECNRIAKLKKLEQRYTSADRLDRAKSHEMFRLYSDYWSKGESEEVIARRWNGGPKGEKKAATAAYWDNVQAKMIGGGK